MIDDMPKREDLPKLTRKELAEHIYDFYIEINITDPKNGVGKAEWVRRMLNGAGAAQPAKKDELVRQLSSILEDRENDMHYIDAVIAENGLERLKSRLDVVKQFSRNTLETELDARDDTSALGEGERNAALSKISTRELTELVEEYRAYKRPYASQIISDWEASEAAAREQELSSIDKLTAQAQELVKSTGKPHVLIEWSESAKVPDETLMTFEDADRMLLNLNLAHRDTGYYKTSLTIFFQNVESGEVDTYSGLRYDIGTERAGIVEHIEDYANNADAVTAGFTSAEEQRERLVIANTLKAYMQSINTKENLEKEVEGWREWNNNMFLSGRVKEYVPFPEYLTVPYNEFADASGYGCNIYELSAWAKEHQNGTKAQKEWIENYLEDINFHTETKLLNEGNYVALQERLEQRLVEQKLDDIRRSDVPLYKIETRINLATTYSAAELQSELDARDSIDTDHPVYANPELSKKLYNIRTEDLYEAVRNYDVYGSEHASKLLRMYKNFAGEPLPEETAPKFDMQERVKELAYEAERLPVFVNRMELSQYRLDTLQKELSEREQGKQPESDLMIYRTDDIKAVIKDYDVYRSDEAAAYHKEWVERVKAEILRPLPEEAASQPTAAQASDTVPKQRQNLKAQLGKYNAEELQKFLSKELEESALKSEESYKQFIEFLAGFRSSRYSPRNQLMLYIQAAQQELLPVFGTFDEWKERNTSIKGGEKGLTICRPLFSDVYYDLQDLVPSPNGEMVPQRLLKFTLTPEKIKELEAGVKNGTVRKETELTSFIYTDSVFSMSQTTMREQDRIEYLQRYNAKNTSEENADLYAKLVDVAAALGRNVKERDIQDESLGWVERFGDEIAIKKDMPTDSKCSVLAHEIGHTLLHIRNATAEGKAQKEVQAQLFSHLAMLKLGIDAEKQFSLHYINSYLKSGARSAPMFDANGNELSPGQILQLNLNAVLPSVDLLVQTVGEKMQPIDKESLKKLQDYTDDRTVDRPRDAKPATDKLKEHKVEIEPLRVYKETDKAALVKLPGATPGSKTPVWLPKSQISINKDGLVYEATPTLIKNKGLTPKAALTAKTGLRRTR